MSGPPAQSPAQALSAEHRAGDLAGRWPLRDSIELDAEDGSVPRARHHARQTLREWCLAGLADNVELAVAELVTNAVAASRCLDWPFPVRLWLLADPTSVLIVVWDANPQPPRQMDPADDAESGRGLVIVDAISARWDWYDLPGVGGKVIRALITG